MSNVTGDGISDVTRDGMSDVRRDGYAFFRGVTAVV